MKPLHIAFFNRSFYPDTAATGQLLTELCEELVQNYGCQVSVVSGVPLIPASKDFQIPEWWRIIRREEYKGIKIIRARGTRFSKKRFIGRACNYISYFFSACLAGLCLKRPDVVVALTDPPIIGLAAYFTSRRFKIPFVMSFRDIFPEVARLLEDFQSDFVEKILQLVTCFLVRKAVRNVTLGESMRNKIIFEKGGHPEKTIVIPDWIDCSQVVPGPRQNPFSRANQLDDEFVVMHSGNIGLSQGLDSLIEAASLLNDLPDLKIVLVGEGVKKEDLKKRVNELNLQNVMFLPFQTKERLTESFGTADVFILSLKSGLSGYIVPSKLYGILAAGRPYVAAIQGDSEAAFIAKKFECGLVALPEDPQSLADQIRTFYRDRELARRMGVNARQVALKFDRAVQVRAYYDLFRDLTRVHIALRSVVLKRAFDIFLSGVGILVSSPLWMLIGFLIKLEDGGPVYYWQERIGKNGRLFFIVKFRSMIPNAEKSLGAVQSQEKDRRVTKIGRLLRATAIDELPQLYNIFRGDMSFVGPRAVRPGEKEVHGDGTVREVTDFPGAKERLAVTPGLTGVAQIYGNHDSFRIHKFRYDLFYIQKQSFLLDLRLILLSFWFIFKGKWKSREKKVFRMPKSPT